MPRQCAHIHCYEVRGGDLAWPTRPWVSQSLPLSPPLIPCDTVQSLLPQDLCTCHAGPEGSPPTWASLTRLTPIDPQLLSSNSSSSAGDPNLLPHVHVPTTVSSSHTDLSCTETPSCVDSCLSAASPGKTPACPQLDTWSSVSQRPEGGTANRPVSEGWSGLAGGTGLPFTHFSSKRLVSFTFQGDKKVPEGLRRTCFLTEAER